MSKQHDESEMVAADAKFDQIMAAIVEAARDDIDDWVKIGSRINYAANTRANCGLCSWTADEMYKLVRLAHAAHGLVTARLLGRDV